MKRLLLAVALFASLGTPAAAQTGAARGVLSPEQVQAAKDAASSIAGTARTRSAQVDERGALVRNPTTGQPASSTGADAAGQLRYLQGLTGLDTTEYSGRSDARGAPAAAVTANASADFACPAEAGRRQAAGGTVLWLQSCALANQRVQSLTVRLCDAISRGGVCESAHFGPAYIVPNGRYVQAGNVAIGVGCNDTTNACRITLTSTFAVSGQGAALATQAEQSDAAAAGNTARATLSAVATDPAYSARMTQLGTELNECVQRNLAALGAEGAVRTCDQQRVIQVTSSANAPSGGCETASQCIREVSRELTYTRTCQRTIPLTTRSCDYEVPTLTCELRDTGAGPTSSCSPESLQGATHVGSSERECLTGNAEEGGGCSQYRWKEYYTFPERARESNCETAPSSLAGSFGPAVCDLSPSGREEQCAPDGWFGRTKTAEECRVQDNAFVGGFDLSANDGEAGKGCGVCVKPRTTYTCYAQPTADNPEDSCQNVDLSNCRVTATQVMGTTEGGLVTSQRETYECKREQRYCAEWQQPAAGSNCPTADISYGLDAARFKAIGSDGSLNQALASAAVLNAIEQNSDPEAEVPLVFNGDDLRCAKPTGGLFGAFYMDCCRIDLQRPSAKTGKLNRCSLADAKLAAARRASYDVYIGEYCSKRIKFPSKCVMRTKTFCVYPGILPRLIQEQGRQQLADIVTSSAGANIERRTLAFDYSRAEGGWTEPVDVNGSRVAAWQYPAYCADPAGAEKRLQEDPTALECPSRLTQWFAVCAQPGGCGALPAAPELGSDLWTLQDADPLRNITTTLSSAAVARGACDPAKATCAYEISAWPAGIGGRAMVGRDLTFALFANEQGDDSGAQLQNIGDIVFQPQPLAQAARAGTLPATVSLRYSNDGGRSWQVAAVPTRLAAELTLPGSEITIQGGCTAESNLCNYRVTAPVTVQAKPWGGPRNPDCSGFTAGQLAALDFSRMDLSEWLATVVDQVSGQSPQALVAAAKSQFQSFHEVFQTTGRASAASPQGQSVARVSPAEGFGPFQVTLQAAGAWPPFDGNPLDNPNRVTGVQVDWGDCSAPEMLSPVTTVRGQPASGFEATHVYPGPDELPAPCGPQARNVTHTLTLSIYTLQSGTQTRNLQVVNAWATMPGHAASGRERNTAANGATLSAPVPGR
jgi:hypothetical protein